jgi:hypothetical protein
MTDDAAPSSHPLQVRLLPIHKAEKEARTL